MVKWKTVGSVGGGIVGEGVWRERIQVWKLSGWVGEEAEFGEDGGGGGEVTWKYQRVAIGGAYH